MSTRNALATNYHAKLGISDKGIVMKGLVVFKKWGVSAYEPDKRSA